MTKPIVRSDPPPAEVVGKKRTRPTAETPQKASKKNRQDDVIKAMGDKPCTERTILEAVGDNRYTREILRRLMALQVVTRVGKGGSNDPFLYRVVKGACIEEMLLVDPALEVRLQRIEVKIIALLAEAGTNITEKVIRAQVGDNTGTGKALRRLVAAGSVIREGRGGAGNPFTYKQSDTCVVDSVHIAKAAAPAPKKAAASSSSPAKKKSSTAPRSIKIPSATETTRTEIESASPSLSSAAITPRESPSRINEEGMLSDSIPASIATTARKSVSDDSDLDSDSEDEDDSYIDRITHNDSDEEDMVDHRDVDLTCEGDAAPGSGGFSLSHHDDGSSDDGELLEMGDLTVIGRSCGIAVTSVEEAMALSNPTPGSDALVASFMVGDISTDTFFK